MPNPQNLPTTLENHHRVYDYSFWPSGLFTAVGLGEVGSGCLGLGAVETTVISEKQPTTTALPVLGIFGEEERGMSKAVEEGVEPPLAALLDGKSGKKTKTKRKSKATTSKDHNTELEPVQAAPEPVQIEPEPIQIEPEPIQMEPEPVQIEPEPIQIEPEPVRIEPEPVRIEPEPVQNHEEGSRDGPRVSVSMFDDSVENHFRVMDTIAKLCGEAEEDHRIEDSEIQSLSSSITFLREWADFKYEPRDVRFACGGGSPDGKDVFTGITLRQFSSATVPKKEALSGDTSSLELSQDFVMYVGGPVWALDWCPRVHQSPDYHPKCEFVAIAAHPPGSSYHKLGQPLTGRGAIQIWCLINVGVNEENSHPIGEKPKREPKKSGAREENSAEPKRPIGRPRKKPLEEKSTEPKRPRGRPRKNPIEESVDKEATEEKSTQPKRPRGRPLKKPIEESVDNLDGSSNYVEALSIQYLEGSPELHSTGCVPANTQEHGKKRKNYEHAASECNPTLKSYARRRKLNDLESAGSNNNYTCPPLLNQNEEKGPLVSDYHIQQSSGQDPQTSNNVQDNDYPKIGSTRCSVPEDVALPRIVLCLAHHGKVAWDVKWRPPSEHDSKCKHRMGYLAVLSGNGSLEVWDVPLPHAIEVIYSSSCREGTDPRFIKLAPVFRCSMLKCGGEKSIPLTVEWSASPAHDYLLAGCHDGTVALWKFSASNASQDTRPLLCFSADTNPIRALAWAPVDSYSEGANVIATAGHGGLKFWDLRDPFRPLWDLDHLPKFIYSLDWLPDPRCVILSFDDGTMKVISLVKAASDDPVTGMAGTKQPGLHNLSCLPFAIWSVHVSRLTGMAAYCGADGTVLRFQLTSKSVEKDPRRHRAPHFLCVSLTMEESAVTINTTVSNTPFPLKVVRNNPEPNKVKSANDKMAKDSASEDQTLALCYGVDPDIQSESGEKVASLKRKKTKKSGSSETTPEDDQALVCVHEEPTSTQEQEIGEKAASVRSRKTQKSRFSKKKPEDNLALVCIDEEPTNTQDEETGVASLKSKKTQKSRSSKKNPNDDRGLVCIGEEEPTNTLEEEIGVASPESKKKQKPRSSKKKPNDDQDLACIDEEPINTQDEEAGKELEIFPEKIVAMHRVRWNMNKGSERWLCYGGAAGLVRCQEIVLSDTEKAWAMKR